MTDATPNVGCQLLRIVEVAQAPARPSAWIWNASKLKDQLDVTRQTLQAIVG
jgi:hypothetical protein